MGNFFTELGAQITELWRRMTLWQRVASVGVLALVPLGLIWLIISMQPKMELLYSNLTESDRVLVEQKLTEMDIRYASDPADNSVRVDPQEVARARMMLANEGIPHARTEDFSLFDKQRLGATEFEQQNDYRRALEGHLRNSILTIEGVRNAVVHLNLPRKTVFTEKELPPSASIILTLQEGTVTEKEVMGIQRLVANAVEGMTPEKVAITDQSGREISKRTDAMSVLTDEQRNFRILEEDSREDKILAALQTAYGNKVDGQAITSIASAHCTADVDHDYVEREITQYDPETVVAKEHISSENAEGLSVPAQGVAGVTSNIMGVGSMTGQGTYSREESTTEYQAGHTKELRRQTPKLKSLSTAVLVNTQVLSGQPGSPQYTQETDQIRRIINGAIGYDPAIPNTAIHAPQVEFISFAPVAAPVTTPPVPWWMNPFVIASLLLGLLALLLLALLLKPRLRREELVTEPSMADALTTAEGTAPALDVNAAERERLARLEQEELERRRRRRQALVDLADANPGEIEKVLRHWSSSSEGSSSS